MGDIDVEKEWRILEGAYSQMSDEELRDLATQAYDLTDIAKQALSAQLSSRELGIKLADAPPASPGADVTEPRGDLDPSNLNLECAAQVWDADEARQSMQALYDAGIPAYLGPENLENVDNFHSSFGSGVEIRVRDKDLQRAFGALAVASQQKEDEDPKADEPYVARCPKCQSEEIVFRGFDSDAPSASQAKFQWTCDACGHEWEDDGIEGQPAC
jgi:DNA-directed RNA polymerase subunit M/transcription elongation factor TFIIS